VVLVADARMLAATSLAALDDGGSFIVDSRLRKATQRAEHFEGHAAKANSQTTSNAGP
jgi:hypothetical protein